MKHLISISLITAAIISLQSCGQKTAEDQLTLDPVGLIPTNLIQDTAFSLTARQKQHLATLTSIFSRSSCFSQMQLDLSYFKGEVYELIHAARLLNNGQPRYSLRESSWYYNYQLDSSKYAFDYTCINDQGRLVRIFSPESSVAEVKMTYDNKGLLTCLVYRKQTPTINVNSGNSTNIIPGKMATDSIVYVYKNGVKVIEALFGDRGETLTVRYFKDPIDNSKSYLFYDFRKGSPIVVPASKANPNALEPTLNELLASHGKPMPGSTLVAPMDNQPLETRMVLCFQGDEPKYMLHYLYYGEDKPDTSALFRGYTFNMTDNQLNIDSYAKPDENVRMMEKYISTVVNYHGNAVIDAIQKTLLTYPSRTTYDNQYFSISGALVSYCSFKTGGEVSYTRPERAYERLTLGR